MSIPNSINYKCLKNIQIINLKKKETKRTVNISIQLKRDILMVNY